MLYTEDTRIEALAVHVVGNKSKDEPLTVSPELSAQVADEGLMRTLTAYFLGGFKSEECYNLHHETDLGCNEVWNFACRIFDDPEALLEHSVSLAKHLYESGMHPQIKGGEFYVAYFTGCRFGGEAVDAVARAYDNDAVLVTDVGQQQMNAARYFGFRRTRSVVTSGGLGTMGFGLPAAIGAKLGAPDREVVLFAGDGGLQMTIQELGTIFQSKIPVKIVLLNNSFLGMVRQWQELFYDRRYSFTEMVNPDFGLIARGNGLSYRCVERREELDEAIAAMKASEGAFLLEVRVEGEENIFPMVPAGAPVSEIRFE